MSNLNPDGVVVAILNSEQVLVRLDVELDADSLPSTQRFVVFEEIELPQGNARVQLPARVRIPKGRLTLVAIQQDAHFALLGVLPELADKLSYGRPRALLDILSPSGVYQNDSPQTPKGWIRPQVQPNEVLGVSTGPIKLGDFVSKE